MTTPRLARRAARLALLFATASLGAAQAQQADAPRRATERVLADRSNEAATRRLPSPVKSFPRLSQRSMSWAAAAIGGELVLVDGCLRINGPSGPLIVWGAENELDLTEPGVVRVFNRMTGKSVRVGERVGGGGGGFDPRPAPPHIDAPIDPACKGPYFAGTGFMTEVEFDAERLSREARDLAARERISYEEAVRRIEARWARAKARARSLSR